MSERNAEIPYVLRTARGNILDVGADHGIQAGGGYAKTLIERGCTLRTVDPVWDADFRVKWEDFQTEERYDTILFVSSMEHFDCSEENLWRACAEVYAVAHAREMLREGGYLVITVPFGRCYRHLDFIQWDDARLKRILGMTQFKAYDEKFYKYNGTDYVAVAREECAGVEYRADGHGAGAVYCGVWRP